MKQTRRPPDRSKRERALVLLTPAPHHHGTYVSRRADEHQRTVSATELCRDNATRSARQTHPWRQADTVTYGARVRRPHENVATVLVHQRSPTSSWS
ncbi:hypothetical protein [Nocardioides sp.]|uniref:hypothetical protein n=1 Tax=Nocardioides sp. TaxID=35761 RepID=UPI003526C5F7